MWNEDDTSDKTESPSPDNPDNTNPNEPVEYVEWTKYSGTYTPQNGTINFPDGDRAAEFNQVSSGNIALSISATGNEGGYNVTFNGTVEFEKTNADGYTCSINSYDMSGASAVYTTSSEYNGLHIRERTSSGLFVSLFDWDSDTINVVFIDENNSAASENGTLIREYATVSFLCRRAAN